MQIKAQTREAVKLGPSTSANGQRPPKPQALPLKPDNIPAELQALAQWVAWRYEFRKDKAGTKPGKWTKPLYQIATGALADSTDPQTWCDFPTALNYAKKYDGIGCTFSESDPYAGIDFDNAIDADGVMAPWAAEMYSPFRNSYAEYSPSGTGFKVWIRGKIPPGRRSFGGLGEGYGLGKVEMFSEGRYFTVTGHKMPSTPATIEDHQEQLNALHAQLTPAPPAPAQRTAAPPATLDDGALLHQAMNASNGPKLAQLWGGDTGAHDGDASRADAALCSMLAFWTGRDAGRMDALFRQSGLMRDKWDQRRGAATYGERTIQGAIENSREVYSPPVPFLRAVPLNGASKNGIAKHSETISAEQIPPPKSTNKKGEPEYSGKQLLKLLHPKWGVENLTSHAAHAQRIRDYLGGELCYNPYLGWLIYDAGRWVRDDKHATRAAARVATLSQVIRDEAATLFNFAAMLAPAKREADAAAMSDAATGLLGLTKQAETKAFIDGALHLAAGILTVETELFDQKPWVIGFQNGTWDRGQWREHRRDDYLLHLSPVALDFGADRGEWLAVLHRISAGDSDFEQMLQDVCGYILSAASHLRLLPFFYGPKGTGKSTIAELLQTVLGDMAATIDPKKLQDDAARERLGADLWNRRLAICSEAGSRRLEAEMLKTLSGGDRLAVRFLFREAFTAPPRHVLLMVTNDPPQMDAYDAALKDRVIALPFIHALNEGAKLHLTGGARIEAVRQDPNSPLVRGFAAWAMEGLARVFESQDIHRAKCLEAATSQFWADTDPLTPFWQNIEESELTAGITKTGLRKMYENWCEAEGARPFPARRWTKACEAQGLEEERRGGGVRFWILRKVTEVTKQGLFSNSTRENRETSHVQTQKQAHYVTSVTGEPEDFK